MGATLFTHLVSKQKSTRTENMVGLQKISSSSTRNDDISSRAECRVSPHNRS